jgi:hypothetical protein
MNSHWSKHMQSNYPGSALRWALAALLGVSFSLQAIAADDQWEFSLTPYLWLPTIGGSLNYKVPPGSMDPPNFSVGPTDWLELLNFGALAGGSARKGKFSVFTDFIYLGLENDSGGRVRNVMLPGDDSNSLELITDVETTLDGIVWSLNVGYTVWSDERAYVDAFVGTRYFGTETETSWTADFIATTPGEEVTASREGRLTQKEELWDAVIGVRGEMTIGNSRWSIPFQVDVGSGSSDLSLNAMTGISYKYGWGDLIFVYRHLEYDQGDGGLFENFSFSGPAFGARFRF